MILFIDTSKAETKIALYKQEQLLAEKVWFSAKNQSEELLYEIDQLIKCSKIDKTDLKQILVIAGPGSYTGLRVGLSTANALAVTLNIKINSIKSGIKMETLRKVLNDNEDQFSKAIMPVYTRQPKITKPKARR